KEKEKEKSMKENDSFDDTIVFMDEEKKKEEKRRSILGELRRREEEENRKNGASLIEVKVEEVEDNGEIKDHLNEEVELRTGDEHDSFYDSFRVLSQRLSHEEGYVEKTIDRSAELFDDSIFKSEEEEKEKEKSGVRVATKRRKSRLSLLSSSSITNLRSPTTSSPLSKQLRREKKAGIRIVDVCSSPVRWNIFLELSRSWSAAGISIGTRVKARSGEEIVGLAITEECRGEEKENGEDIDVYYIPLTDNDIYGNAADEEIAATSTPLETISIRERKEVLLNLLESLNRILLFDALRSMELIRSYFQISSLSCTPVCLSYLSFLAHLRRGESPMSLYEVASSLSLLTRWQPFLSSSSPRLKAGGAAFICARIETQLLSIAVSLSSRESVEMEMKAVAAISRMAGRGFGFARRCCDVGAGRMRERMEEIERETTKFTHGRTINLESPSHIAEVLFTTLNLPYPGGAELQRVDIFPLIRMFWSR
ncbi:hypothetical protein PMAYCL1PPCAC_12587, partial [Pristionchus mayeri]